VGGDASAVCLAACDSLGSAGGLIFAVLAFAWGEWQRRRVRSVRAEVEQLKQSLRPPAPQRVELVHMSLPPGGELPAPPRVPRTESKPDGS